MMADDMGMGDTSAYQDFTGNADDVQISTPNMEKLARMGVRFTDAHTPASRCSPTRYALLTGRYAWRNRLKHWVLFGSQGDPMIEADRPTIASMLRDVGYGTAMVGKWHVGLRYTRSDGSAAAGWEDADLTKPLHTSPIDNGFDYARFTSRSHGTSGPDPNHKNKTKRNTANQNVGPGHIHGKDIVGATGDGKRLVSAEHPDAYVLTKLGSRHSNHAFEFLESHLAGESTKQRPFFLFYPSNSNHGPYTPDEAISGTPVAGASRTKSGKPMDARHDYIYENDVALGRLMDWLEATADPRNPGKNLVETTLVIFTSDNGAEITSKVATGPFRSHKGSCYEGGHRVAFIAAWGRGGIGDGDALTPGLTNESVIGLQDLYATFAELAGQQLPDPRAGEKGGEDSVSVLTALRGEHVGERMPIFFNDHVERKIDPAVAAMRFDDGQGKWKIFFDAELIRDGVAKPFELYELGADPKESTNLIDRPELKPVVDRLTALALNHRNAGGHRLAELGSGARDVFEFRNGVEFKGKVGRGGLKLDLTANRGGFTASANGLGLTGGEFDQVDAGEALEIRFNRDVVIESAAIVAGNGVCGGFYKVGDGAPLAIYCVDADIDAKDQQGILSDIGVLKAGETFRLDSSSHFGSEPAGRWRLATLTVRDLER
ncbi:MAG: arylsulfatase A [Verrucomicrobiales bacterium]|jgi:arylsulfatase A